MGCTACAARTWRCFRRGTRSDAGRGDRLAALVAVYYTAHNADNARRTFQLGEQGQVTERYTKAIGQLGSDKLDIRPGGIYALDRTAPQPPRAHPAVMDVLTAFVREPSPAKSISAEGDPAPDT